MTSERCIRDVEARAHFRIPDVGRYDDLTSRRALHCVGLRYVVLHLKPDVVCTNELGVVLSPAERTVAVGEGFTAAVALSTCGGLPLADTFNWWARDLAVVRVDPATGRITGVAQGATWVEVTGDRYGLLGAARVTVR